MKNSTRLAIYVIAGALIGASIGTALAFYAPRWRPGTVTLPEVGHKRCMDKTC